jgi:RHS repeat-associated protein
VEYYHLDAVGSVRAITDQNGPTVERHEYLPFGEEWSPQSGSQPLRFVGKERDGETGLDYFGARFYASGRGRFLSVDPALNPQAALFDPRQWNRYSYGRSNPFRYRDPDGRRLVVEGSPEFKLKVEMARSVARGNSGGGDSVLEEIDDRPQTITIWETRETPDFTPNSNVIYWNPRLTVRSSDKGDLSPTTLLVHAAHHALRRFDDPVGLKRDNSMPDDQHDTVEERRVISGPENRFARSREEVPRKKHTHLRSELIQVDDVGASPPPLDE